GSGPDLARDHGVARRVAALDRQSLLYGWTASTFAICAAHVGWIFDGGVGRRHAEDHHDEFERGLLSAQRRAFERSGYANAVLDWRWRHSHVGHHRLRSAVPERADDPG